MSAGRWIRLDVGWEDSWLEDLSGAAAGCWPRLLCWVKRDGVRGRCKRPRTETLVKRWRVDISDVLTLEAAAVRDGALVIQNDHWLVVNWEKYQGDPTATDRKRRERSRVTDVTDVTRDTPGDTDLLSRTTGTLTGTETQPETEAAPKARGKRSPKVPMPEDWKPNATHGRIAQDERVDVAREAVKFREHAAANARRLADWDAGFCTWLRRAAEYAPRPKVIHHDFGNETARDELRRAESLRRQGQREAEKRAAEEESAEREAAELDAWWEEADADTKARVQVAAAEKCKGMPKPTHRALTRGVMAEFFQNGGVSRAAASMRAQGSAT